MCSTTPILLVDNVVTLAMNNLRPREHREVDTLLESGRFCPYILVTEPVLLTKPLQFFKTHSFVDTRVQTYRIPCFAIGTLSYNRMLSLFGKLMFGITNAILQAFYFFHLVFFTLCLVLVKKIRLIHAHNPPDLTGFASLLVSKITGIPYVFEVHDRAPELYCGEMGIAESSLIFKLMKSLEYLVVANSKAVITVNQRVADYFNQYRGANAIAIYTGAKIDKKILTAPSHESHKLSHKRIILYQGALNMASVGKPAIYNLALPIKAMPIILNSTPDAILVFVGEGTGRRNLEKLSESMKLTEQVIFTGFLSQNQVFEWINAASVVLIPYADNPNCRTTVPSKLYEYMAIGKPIVATCFPGIQEVIEDENNGLLYGVDSLDEFCRCVLKILNNLELAKKLSLNAKRDFFSKYSLEKNWPKLISVYDQIIK